METLMESWMKVPNGMGTIIREERINPTRELNKELRQCISYNLSSIYGEEWHVSVYINAWWSYPLKLTGQSTYHPSNLLLARAHYLCS